MHLIKVRVAQDYIELVRHPSLGRGSTMNQYIDYRIYMLRQSRQVAQQIGARFFIAGDVLGQGPMPQQRSKLAVEDKKPRLERLILRPLSSRLLLKTLPEA